MPRVRFKPMIVETQATMYDVVFKKSPKGKTMVTKRPDMSNVKWSQAQKAQRKRMRQANQYATVAMANPDIRAGYDKSAAKEDRQPYRVAVSDYFKGKNLLTQPEKSPRSQKPKRRNHSKS